MVPPIGWRATSEQGAGTEDMGGETHPADGRSDPWQVMVAKAGGSPSREDGAPWTRLDEANEAVSCVLSTGAAAASGWRGPTGNGGCSKEPARKRAGL